MSSSEVSKAAGLRVLVLSGPSGSGKTTIVNRLLEISPVKLRKAVSATTRPPRAGEVDGEDYYFLSAEEFSQRRAAGDFLECAEVHARGCWYGTLQSELEQAQKCGCWAFLEIDVQGAVRVMEQHPQAVTIFLSTPSENEYARRLRSRGTESEEVIQRRLETARDELRFADRYRYRVVNDDLDRAVGEITDILLSQEV